MIEYLFVAIGAACGGVLRYWMTGIIQSNTRYNFPFGTLVVNVLGSFILGFIIFVLDVRELISPRMKILLAIGLCGGFTTFSTFSIETINLLIDTETLFALLNVLVNVILSIVAVFLAYSIAKII
jgi:CrcB protein